MVCTFVHLDVSLTLLTEAQSPGCGVVLASSDTARMSGYMNTQQLQPDPSMLGS